MSIKWLRRKIIQWCLSRLVDEGILVGWEYNPDTREYLLYLGDRDVCIPEPEESVE